jgi:adenylate cyclase
MTTPPTNERDEEYWRDFLTHPDTFMGFGRRMFGHVPTDPRCMLCAAPFKGIGGSAMRLIGKRQSDGNPNICTSCQSVMIKHHGGAEVDATMLFADIRGSTTIAERMSSQEFRALLDRFYTVASEAVFAHGGILDKFVGDEVVAAFAPLLGMNYSERAVAAARDILKATGHEKPGGPWAPIGAGVHTGRVWFGAVGEGSHTELVAVGDAVNVTARLAALAGAGEILVSAAAAEHAGLDADLPRRSLELKGKKHAIEVVSLRVGAA